MNRMTRHTGWALVLPLLVTIAVAALACSTTTQFTNTLSGTVVDENEAPIANAQVVLVGTSQKVLTGSAGTFSFTSHAATNANASVLSVSAEGYAPQYRNYKWTAQDLVLGSIHLRSVSVSQSVALPTSPNTVATVGSTLGDGGVGVVFGYQALALPDGTPASGNATVNLTYWHPQGNLQSIPGALVALDENGPSPLRTFGMLSVNVWQGETELQIASGHTATLQFTTPSNMLSTMLNATVPNLYWLDPNTGMWRLQNTTGDGNLVLDANTGLFSAQVPHLSEWNMDGTYEFGNGGCMTGSVYNMCSPLQGAANTAVSVWFLGLEQLKRWDVITDSSGNYCVNIGLGDYQGTPSTPQGFPVSYMITETADITQPGTMCNPLPSQCRTCNPAYATWTYPPCNDCRIKKPGVPPGYAAPGQVTGPYYSDCSPPTPEVFIQPCHFCPGTAPSRCSNTQYNASTGSDTSSPSQAYSGGCFQLQKIGLQAPGCNCTQVGGSCQQQKTQCCPVASGSSVTQSVCGSANKCVPCTKTRGQTCTQSDGCCDTPPGAEPLVCEDNVCVPASDPSAVD